MKQTLLLVLLLMVYLPSFGQKNNVFNTIAESIEPYETWVFEVEEKIGEKGIETTIGPKGVKEVYFKRIGIGFLGTRQSNANVAVVHLKETNQQSDEYFFRKNIKVQDVYKKLGEPHSYRYDPDTEILTLRYKYMMGYEIYNVKKTEQLTSDYPLPFKMILPSIQSLPIDYLIIDFAHNTVPPLRELVELEVID